MRPFTIGLSTKSNGDVIVSVSQKDRSVVSLAYTEIIEERSFTDKRAIKRLKRLYEKDFSKLSAGQHCWLVTKLSEPICAQLCDDLVDFAPTQDLTESIKFAQAHLVAGIDYIRATIDYFLSNWDTLAITDEWFRTYTGKAPQDDDLERCNCKYQGTCGHFMCGWDYDGARPRFW